MIDVNKTTDGLGRGIDENVKGVVHHLNRLGIITRQSCEGHLERGCPHFYIDFSEQFYDSAISLIYHFNREHFNLCVDRRAYYDPTNKIMYCRLMPIDQKKDEKTYKRNKELLKDFEKYLSDIPEFPSYIEKSEQSGYTEDEIDTLYHKRLSR